MQRFAVWFGGSMLGSLPQFYQMAHSKQEYDEIGPAVARKKSCICWYLSYIKSNQIKSKST